MKACASNCRLKSPPGLPVMASRMSFSGSAGNLSIASTDQPVDLTFDAVVEVVEKLGSETLLDSAVGQEMMVASVDPSIRVAIHQKLRLAMNPDRIHFFDAGTEAAI